MRHHNKNRKFGREKNQRTALFKSLARSLLLRGTMTTSEAKAKEIRPMVEKMLTRAKNPTLANRRMLVAQLGDKAAVTKAVTAAEKYKTRAGGYLRIIKVGPRKGDAAPMAIIELV